MKWGVYQKRHSHANAGPGRGVPVGRGHQRHRLSRGAYRYQGADAHRSRLALSGRSTSGTGIKQLLRDDLSHQCHRFMGGGHAWQTVQPPAGLSEPSGPPHKNPMKIGSIFNPSYIICGVFVFYTHFPLHTLSPPFGVTAHRRVARALAPGQPRSAVACTLPASQRSYSPSFGSCWPSVVVPAALSGGGRAVHSAG